MKNLQNYIPVPLLALYVLGVLLQFYFKVVTSYPPLLIATIFLLLFTYFYVKKGLLLGAFLIGMGSMFLHDSSTVVLPTSEKRVQMEVIRLLKSNSEYDRYQMLLSGDEGFSKKIKVWATIEKDSSKIPFEIGTVLLTKTQFHEIKKPLNPFDFNFKNYLQKQNIRTQFYFKSSQVIPIYRPKYSLVRSVNQLRNTLKNQLTHKINSPDAAAVAMAMLLGERTFISEDLQQSYTKAGVIHVLAVSGLHIGIVVLLLHFLLKPLAFFKNGKEVNLGITILFLIFFAFLAGLSASVVRSVVMYVFVTIGVFLGSRTTVYYSLISSAFLLLLVNPFYLFDVGFQLSYLAVFSIVTFQPFVYSLWQPKFKLVDYFWKLSTVSLAAQLGVLPLSLYYFHQFPALFILANLVVIPCIGLVLVYGIFILIFSFFSSTPHFFFLFYEKIILFLNGFITWISKQEEFVFSSISFSGWQLIVAYLLVAALLLFLLKQNFQRLVSVLSLIVVFQFVCIYEKYASLKNDRFMVCHASKATVILHKNRGSLIPISSDSILVRSMVANYKQANFVFNIKKEQPLKSIYEFQKHKILVIDELGVYSIKNYHPTIVVLHNSPKINLERMLSQIHPKTIVVDGSNYFYLKAIWASTCKKYGVQFYDTYRQGAYLLP